MKEIKRYLVSGGEFEVNRHAAGDYVEFDDHAVIVAALQEQVLALADGLENMAGAMLNRTLDSGSKQAVAYADCADMVAKYAARIRTGEQP